jgi:hypothetical protein
MDRDGASLAIGLISATAQISCPSRLRLSTPLPVGCLYMCQYNVLRGECSQYDVYAQTLYIGLYDF